MLYLQDPRPKILIRITKEKFTCQYLPPAWHIDFKHTPNIDFKSNSLNYQFELQLSKKKQTQQHMYIWALGL